MQRLASASGRTASVPRLFSLAALAAGILGWGGALPRRAEAAPRTVRVSGYQLFLARCRPRGGEHERVCLRRLVIGGRVEHLVVDPSTLSTGLVPASELDVESLAWPELRHAFEATPYMAAVARAEARKAELQDGGIVHVLPARQGVVLTIDLCPSRTPLDRGFFTQVIDAFRPVERPVPVGVSVTGIWMLEHPDDLRWLRDRAAAGDLEITWINHSYHHAYDPRRPLSRDFLLEPGTDLEAEVLRTEVAMLERGILPSVFFRFPGLVSDQKTFERVVSFGLIPTGSDAWLAKGQRPTPGSIVLVHGNGNEPRGVRDFLELVRRERDRIKGHGWLLLDLRASATSAPPS